MEKNGRVLIAEGYLFEFMRRGKIRLGSLIPEVVLDDPESVRSLHQEFVDAGSDVVQAFTVSPASCTSCMEAPRSALDIQLLGGCFQSNQEQLTELQRSSASMISG